jgi:hypothetical protein
VTTAVPLIGVLSLTAIKDAYDDIVSCRYPYIRTYRTQKKMSNLDVNLDVA